MIFLTGRLSSDDEQLIFTRMCKRDGEAALYCITLSMQVCGSFEVNAFSRWAGWSGESSSSRSSHVHIVISFHQGGSGPYLYQPVLSPI